MSSGVKTRYFEATVPWVSLNGFAGILCFHSFQGNLILKGDRLKRLLVTFIWFTLNRPGDCALEFQEMVGNSSLQNPR